MPHQPTTSGSNSGASTPHSRRGSNASSVKKRKGGSATPRQKDRPKQDKIQIEEAPWSEEDQFDWDFESIFKDEESHETVALAQALSTNDKTTPVPLLDPRTRNTVSRNARKDNLKEYIKSIRKSPQWEYLKQDPVFRELNDEGILIPLSNVQTWMEARHGSDAVPVDQRRSSGTRRKRSREESEQYDVDGQVQSEMSQYQKRQRVDEPQQDGDVGTFTREATPMFARSGTPYLGAVDDDAWVPQPGDAFASDPTEALLASLGVTGAPKPVKPRQFSGSHEPTHGHPSSKQVSQDRSSHPYDPPKRKESGYNSVGAKNGVSATNGHGGEHTTWKRQSRSSTYDGSHDYAPPPPPPPPPIPAGFRKDHDSGSETKEDSSPLSPTSREILGSLGAPAEPSKQRKIIGRISGKKNSEPTRQEDDVTPRYRKSQPVVEEAYRYVI